MNKFKTIAAVAIGLVCLSSTAGCKETPPEPVTYSVPVEAIEVWIEPEPVVDEAPPYLGDFRITVYTPECDGGVWGYQTATGVTSQHLATCAVDPDVIPLGTVIDLGGELTLAAVDTGSAVKGNVVDVFYDGSYDEAMNWIAEFGDSAPVWIQVEG